MSDPQSADEDEIRDVYAHFGLAVYVANVLEQAIINCLTLSRLVGAMPNVSSAAEWERIHDEEDRLSSALPMGRLIARLRDKLSISDKLSEKLSAALANRNWLVHKFFHARADSFFSSEGRGLMVRELEQIREQFSSAEAALEEETIDIRLKLGISDEKIEEIFSEMVSKASKGPNERDNSQETD